MANLPFDHPSSLVFLPWGSCLMFMPWGSIPSFLVLSLLFLQASDFCYFAFVNKLPIPEDSLTSTSFGSCLLPDVTPTRGSIYRIFGIYCIEHELYSYKVTESCLVNTGGQGCPMSRLGAKRVLVDHEQLPYSLDYKSHFFSFVGSVLTYTQVQLIS